MWISSALSLNDGLTLGGILVPLVGDVHFMAVTPTAGIREEKGCRIEIRVYVLLPQWIPSLVELSPLFQEKNGLTLVNPTTIFYRALKVN